MYLFDGEQVHRGVVQIVLEARHKEGMHSGKDIGGD